MMLMIVGVRLVYQGTERQVVTSGDHNATLIWTMDVINGVIWIRVVDMLSRSLTRMLRAHALSYK